jgi:threonine dehydrogenase-like Zn-dependent dehydrogenase
MKAVNYQGPFKVKIEDVPRPQIEHPDDVIVKVTTAGQYTADTYRKNSC